MANLRVFFSAHLILVSESEDGIEMSYECPLIDSMLEVGAEDGTRFVIQVDGE